jgi:hypothetical protein
MTTATEHLNWPRLALDRGWAAAQIDCGDRALRRDEFRASLPARERALGAKCPDRSAERRN